MKSKATLPFIIGVPLIVILAVVGVAIAMRSGEQEGRKALEKQGYEMMEQSSKGDAAFESADSSVPSVAVTAGDDELTKELQSIKESDDGLDTLDTELKKL